MSPTNDSVNPHEAESGRANADEPVASRYPLRGSVIRYDEPFDLAVDPGDWDAMR
ncbi:MAG: hypothetical protein WD768_07690 [Phycisphaeraceae bacterium]